MVRVPRWLYRLLMVYSPRAQVLTCTALLAFMVAFLWPHLPIAGRVAAVILATLVLAALVVLVDRIERQKRKERQRS